MGLLSSIFGGTKTTVPKAPREPNVGLSQALSGSLEQSFRNPEQSKEFGLFTKTLGDTLAKSRNQFLDALAEQYGMPGGPGLQSGSASRARLLGETAIGGAGADATRQFLADFLARRNQSATDFLRARYGYKSSIFQTQTQGTRVEHTPGLLDYINKAAQTVGNVYGTIYGADAFGASGIMGLLNSSPEEEQATSGGGTASHGGFFS